MILDDLKSAWEKYDDKILIASRVNERIIMAMITARSQSRWEGVKKKYTAGFLWMLLWIFAGVAILAGNPFDYKYLIQFIPVVVYVLCLAVLTSAMARSFVALKQVDFTTQTLDASLNKIIDVYEKPAKFATWTLRLLIFSSTILFPLSFLPKKLDHMETINAVGETVLAMAISATVIFIAHKLGAFNAPDKDRFKEDLAQLGELKTMVHELKN